MISVGKEREGKDPVGWVKKKENFGWKGKERKGEGSVGWLKERKIWQGKERKGKFVWLGKKKDNPSFYLFS